MLYYVALDDKDGVRVGKERHGGSDMHGDTTIRKETNCSPRKIFITLIRIIGVYGDNDNDE